MWCGVGGSASCVVTTRRGAAKVVAAGWNRVALARGSPSRRRPPRARGLRWIFAPRRGIYARPGVVGVGPSPTPRGFGDATMQAAGGDPASHHPTRRARGSATDPPMSVLAPARAPQTPKPEATPRRVVLPTIRATRRPRARGARTWVKSLSSGRSMQLFVSGGGGSRCFGSGRRSGWLSSSGEPSAIVSSAPS